jgi:ribonuclease P protein component
MRETHISAQYAKASPEARVSSSHGGSSRPGNHQGSAAQGSGAPVGVVHSLRGRSVFDELHRRGRRVRKSGVTVTFLSRPDDEHLSLGFSIGRNVGSAVVRNRVRRRLRSIVAETGAPTQSGWLLITVSPALGQAEYGELQRVVTAALREVFQP